MPALGNFILGLVLLVAGSKGVIDFAVGFASKLRISPLVIGFTVVGILTSLPEIMVTVYSGIDKAPDLGAGNIIGSNIANICLIFGISSLLDNVYIGHHKTQQNMRLMLWLTILFSLLLITHKLSNTWGLVFLSLGTGVIVWQFFAGKKGAEQEDKKRIKKMSVSEKNSLLLLTGTVVSIILVLAGSKLSVDAGVSLAYSLGISPFIIGLTAVAIGTSLPELAISISGAIKHEDKLLVGNILGSNLYNILLCGGILGLFDTPLSVNTPTILFFIAVTWLLSTLIYYYKGRHIPKFWGVLFLGIYIGYTLIIFNNPRL